MEPLSAYSENRSGNSHFTLGKRNSTFYQIFLNFLDGRELAEEYAERIWTFRKCIVHYRKGGWVTLLNRGEMSIGKNAGSMACDCLRDYCLEFTDIPREME